jgi:hypothetical protein
MERIAIFYGIKVSERSVPRMNTKIKQDQKKNQRQKTREKQEPKKRGQNSSMLHHQDHEHPETRMTD